MSNYTVGNLEHGTVHSSTQYFSGRYTGDNVSPATKSLFLELRVDVDPRYPNSPVMNKVSGDIYEKAKSVRVYKESWIVDNLIIKSKTTSQMTIEGSVHYYKGGHPATTVNIIIDIGGNMQIAYVTLRESGNPTSYKYTCIRGSDKFRDVTLEVDICKSVNTLPRVPSYYTLSHPDRPADLVGRTLTIEEAYKEAGITLIMKNITDKPTSIIDDSDTQFASWTSSELHDAMEQNFSKYGGQSQRWHVWCLLAGTYENSAVGGIMFDTAVSYGGAGKPAERQGCAVFRKHQWFNDLVASPTNETQHAAMRKYLYTYVHEIGHAFNFLHSWNKGKPDALSWMNYDWRYDDRNGAGEFWKKFPFTFDTEELQQLRHGDRSSVIMGGDPWSSGPQIEAPSKDTGGKAPVLIIVRSKDSRFFEYMEPVIVELKVQNRSKNPVVMDTQLSPEYGSVKIEIKRPDGQTLVYSPPMEMLATPTISRIQSGGRIWQNVNLSFGRHGHYFKESGTYGITAVYYGYRGLPVRSGTHEIKIGEPSSSKERKDAKDFFSRDAGMALYLGGSDSEFLKNGMKTLNNMAQNYKDTAVGAHISLVLANNLSRPFHTIDKGKRRLIRVPDDKGALTHLKSAFDQHESDEQTFTNITYNEASTLRIGLLARMGKKNDAKIEAKSLINYLESKKVDKDVIEQTRNRLSQLGV